MNVERQIPEQSTGQDPARCEGEAARPEPVNRHRALVPVGHEEAANATAPRHRAAKHAAS